MTELVDEQHAGGTPTNWAEWDQSRARTTIAARLARKDDPSQIKGGPYSKYFVVLFTDEPIPARRLRELLQGATFGPFHLMWVLASYQPGESIPHVALRVSQNA